ncbi:MAG: T9SS type A sorting domain-containing protein [Bacteroidia bacterium]
MYQGASISLEQFPAGVYMVHVVNRQQSQVFKVIKQ